MRYYSSTEKSTKRNNNEDNYLIKTIDDNFIFAVSDGLGGLSDGEVASKMAVDELATQLTNNPGKNLVDIFNDINERIVSEGKKNEKTMGTTLATAIVDKKNNKISIAHVGDSRAYLIQDKIWRTKDHTLVQELVDMGILDKKQAFNHSEKHRLNKALGTHEKITVDTFQTTMNEGFILLCSDGLSDFVSDEDLKNKITNLPFKKASEELIKLARDNGSTDDITFIIAKL